MIFNSLPFLVFVAIFIPLYFALKGRARLLLALAGSYLFYGWWDWRFLSLIAISTLVDFWVGAAVYKEQDEKRRKRLLLLSMVVNLGFLGFFKYFDFFIASFVELLQSFGLQPSVSTLGIILPVGISFYTFQSMSYTIDIYRRKLEPEHDLVKFATFVAFWPQLVAGPIVRASDFLPQFRSDHPFEWDRFTKGSAQVLWGFFKKVAIADSLAPIVDQCFSDPMSFGSVNLYIAVFFYSFQIYCDFSGYSDIAIGFARMLGFDFPANFRTPYFSKNFSEFWTRWHISLSSWLRDYLYIPLGGNRHGTAKTYRNLMLTMLLGGLWHGANWTFVFWGWLHGMYLVVQRLFSNVWTGTMRTLRAPGWLNAGLSILLVYLFTNLAWVFFRSPDFATAAAVLQNMASLEGFTVAQIMNKFLVAKGVLLIGFLLLVEISDFRFNYSQLVVRQPVFRLASFAVLLWLIAFFGTFNSNAFIYFQF
ncbi:MAG: membrane-bound O-acyltransferase family protein [Saprospirales bacterium]|nr:membrane-bound O-acyltransferase family protein [Saprospirales bacterium]